MSTGNHTKHISVYGAALTACVNCHPNNTTFTHATSAKTGGAIRVGFSGAPKGTGTYTAGTHINYPNYLTGTGTYGSCSNTYCHGTSTPPTWGTAGPLLCSQCHDASNTGLSTRHDRHYNSATPPTAINTTTANTATAYVYGCGTCHPSASHAAGPVSGVQDAQIDLTGKISAYTPAGTNLTDAKGFRYTNYGTCTTVCHSKDGVTPGSAIVTPNWGTAATGTCGVCHSKAGDASPTWSAPHTKHINGYAANTNFTCNACHSGTATNNTTINGIAGRNQHPNANRDVAFNAWVGGTVSGAQGSQQCSNIYCHGNGQSLTPTNGPLSWSGTMNADCSSCHGGNSTAATRITSNVHAQHLYSTARVGRTLACGDCHSSTVSIANDRSLIDLSVHVNQAVNINFSTSRHINRNADGPTYNGGSTTVAGGYAKAVGTAGYTCNNLYCHSTGNLGTSGNLVNSGGVKFRSITWNGTGLGCDGCHGNQAGKAHPVYASGQAGYSSSNSHVKHVEGSLISCDYCHFNTVTQSTIPPTQVRLNDYSGHLNRNSNIRFKLNNGLTGTFNPGNAGATTKTCSNTYCHGATSTSAAWGSPALACNSCHSANNALPGAHQIHVTTAAVATSYSNMSGNVSTASNYRFSCAACHSPLKGAKHANGPQAGGVNGPAEVFFGFTTATMKGGTYNYAGASAGTDPKGGFSYTAGGTNAGSCNNTYCHSNGQGANGLATVSWGTTASSGTCVQCHDTKQTSLASGLSTKHDKHMNPSQNTIMGLGNGFNCIDCHAKTVSNNLTIGNKANHVNRFIDFSSNHGGGSAKYSTATKTCTNIYCHSNGNTSSIVYADPAAWNSATTYNCNGCHGISNPSTGSPDYPNGGAAPSPTANSHSKHVTVLGITTTTGCTYCHIKTVNASTANKFKDYSAATYHINGTPDVKFDTAVAGASASYSAAAATCSNVACHTNAKFLAQSVPKWGETSNCAYCHPIASLKGAHGVHVDLTQIPVQYSYTANRSTVAKYNYGCTFCHPLTNANHMKGSSVLIDLRNNATSGVQAGSLKNKNQAIITQGAVVAGTAGSGTYVSGSVLKCSNIYCHSNGGGQGGQLAVLKCYTTPDWYVAFPSTSDRCAMCHGNSPNSGKVGSVAHYNTNWLGYANVSSGHSLGIHDKNISKGSNQSGLLGKSASAPSAHGVAATSTTINCNACHYNTVRTFANDKNVVCVKCHTGASAKGLADQSDMIADKRFHVSGTVNVAFRNMTALKTPAQVRDLSQSNYSSAFRRTTGDYKATATSHDTWNPKKTPSYSAGTCSNVACHNSQSVNWSSTNGATNCASCHTDL